MATSMSFEILPDGQVKIKTSEIGDAHHVSADELLDLLEQELGGERKVEKVKPQFVKEFWKGKTVQKGGKIVKAKS